MVGVANITRFSFNDKIVTDSPLYLSVFISERAFMYATTDSSNKELKSLVHVEFDGLAHPDPVARIAALINDQGLSRSRFGKTLITVLNTDFSLIPRAYAETGSPANWLEFATGMGHDKKTNAHRVGDMTFLSGTDAALVNYLEKTFNNSSIRPAGWVTLNLLFTQHSLAGTGLFLNLHDDLMELCAVKEGAVLFYNVFRYVTNEDILYYLLFTIEQSGLSPKDLRLAIACQRPVTDPLIESIKRYIPHLRFCVGQPDLEMKGAAATLPQHYYFTLLNQHLCGS